MYIYIYIIYIFLGIVGPGAARRGARGWRAHCEGLPSAAVGPGVVHGTRGDGLGEGEGGGGVNAIKNELSKI